MIKDVNGRFDDYSISTKIRQILLLGAMNYLKVICYDFFCLCKNELLLVQ